MAKNVFRSSDVKRLDSRVNIEAPFPPQELKEAEEVQAIDEYTGPTADDLRREAEAFKQNWDQEREAMISEAREEAQKIIKEAEETAYDMVKQKTDESKITVEKAKEEAEEITRTAQDHADTIVSEAEEKSASIEKEAKKQGYDEGRNEGFEEGKAESQRLVAQLHAIINGAIAKRNEIIEDSETQLVELVLLIAKKVVKVISENQKNIVVNNVIQSLRKLKTRGDVVIRVNLQDVELTSDHVQDFMKMVESVKSITVMEDTTVDPGGCILETDFGQIDARISSQFKEIEEKILEMTPIRTRTEG